MPFCTDTDLLSYEPLLFRDAVAAAQTLLAGTAAVDGTLVTLPAPGPVAASVVAGDVITFTGTALAGCYPILGVGADSTLTISVLHQGVYPEEAVTAGDVLPSPSLVGSAAAQPFVIRTSFPQRRIVSQMILEAAGLGAVEAAVVNPRELARACALGTLQMVYGALAAVAGDPIVPAARADLYGALFRRALRAARVEVDTDGDGKADDVRRLNAVTLVRG